MVHLYNYYISIGDYIYTVYYQKHCLFFIHPTVFLLVNHDGIYVPPSNWLQPIWIYFVCYDLKEFVFSHGKATSSFKKYFHALEMDKTYIYVVSAYKASFQWRHLFVMMRKQYGRHVNFNYLPLRLNLVHFDWHWQTKCKKVLIAIDYNGHTV